LLAMDERVDYGTWHWMRILQRKWMINWAAPPEVLQIDTTTMENQDGLANSSGNRENCCANVRFQSRKAVLDCLGVWDYACNSNKSSSDSKWRMEIDLTNLNCPSR
jgi:hypothetical protein